MILVFLHNNITMKANVQYNDYQGTTAADRSDFLETHIAQLTEIIVKAFEITVQAEEYEYVGISVYGIEVEDVCATFYFRNKETKEVVKYFKSSVPMQSILNLFKRFEFQIGYHLEDIDRETVREIGG